MKKKGEFIRVPRIISILLIGILHVQAQIIPPERRINWKYAGMPGGIPHRTAIFRTIEASDFGNGKIDASSEIQTALNKCSEGQVVYLPSGVFKIMKSLEIRSNITLRGDGPGKTILSFGGTGRSAIHMDAGFYSQIMNTKNMFRVIAGMTKGSFSLELSGNRNMKPGDLLLIDELNDGALVDANGVEGFCNYCGRANGTRTLGQILKINALVDSSGKITIQQALNFGYVPSLDPEVILLPRRNFIEMAGVEDLTITQASASYAYLVEMQGTTNCWLRNVEMENVDWRAVWLLYGLQNEIRECYIHTSVSGYGRSHGYGVYLDNFSTSNLVENNVFRTIDGGGVMLGSGSSGNVIAYNIISDHKFDDYWWVNGSPSLNHNPHPVMNLWEGNVGDKLEADFIHGSSSHNTIFRSRSRGWQNDSATTANAAVALAKGNTYYNVIGCVLGTQGKSNQYEVVAGQHWNSTDKAIWLLGVTNNIAGNDVLPTLIRHGNFDYYTNSVKWDSLISDHILPASLYLSKAPFFFGTVPWPPIGPDVTNYTNKIPSEHWLEQIISAAYNTAPVASNQEITTAINTSVVIRLSATDSQNDQLRFSISNKKGESPAHGSLYWTGAGLVFHPAKGYTGVDSFIFNATDGRFSSNNARITIHVENIKP